MNLKRVRMNLQLGTLKRESTGIDGKELGDLMRMVEVPQTFQERSCEGRKITDPAKRKENGELRISGESKNDRKPPFDKDNNGRKIKAFEKKNENGKVWKMSVRTVKKAGKKAPAPPESWKPGAPERKGA